jgi:hypothetical protein
VLAGGLPASREKACDKATTGELYRAHVRYSRADRTDFELPAAVRPLLSDGDDQFAEAAQDVMVKQRIGAPSTLKGPTRKVK